ncbi:condensation domain-containing protein [Vibrio sp. PP-XX7]
MEAFTEALQVVINRHDILRTAIVWEGLDEPVQVVWRDATLPVTKLTIESDDVAMALQQQFDSSHTRMDVRRAPMIEAYQAADPNENRWLLCLLIHHLCNDHTTLELLMAEVQAYLLGQTDHWVKPLPFRNFVAQACLGRDRDAQAAYFHEQLADIDTPSAPFGLLDVQGGGQHIGDLHVPVDDGLSQRLRHQARLLSVSTASLFHLAWGLVVRATTGGDDVVFGTVLFGRMAAGEGADRMLGMFLNTLPLRLSLGDAPVKEVVRDTHTRLAELLEHEHGSLALAQQCSGMASQTPLFSSLLNYRYQTGTVQLLLEHSQIDIVFSEERTNYPISVSVNDYVGQGFSLDVQVDNRIGCERIGMMMVTALSALADALESHPAMLVQSLNLLPAAERQQVLYGLNQTDTAYPEAGLCIHQRFEQQVVRQPDAIAVIDAHQQLSYQALNEQANQLAHWLVELGVRPDSRVAVSLERSCELVVALVAILKAGGKLMCRWIRGIRQSG